MLLHYVLCIASILAMRPTVRSDASRSQYHFRVTPMYRIATARKPSSNLTALHLHVVWYHLPSLALLPLNFVMVLLTIVCQSSCLHSSDFQLMGSLPSKKIAATYVKVSKHPKLIIAVEVGSILQHGIGIFVQLTAFTPRGWTYTADQCHIF